MPGAPSTTYASNGETRSQAMPGRQFGDVWLVAEVVFAEVLGTAFLVFFVCMSQVNFLPGEPLPPLQGAIMTAVVVATVVQIFGHISAAHINPAVTVALLTLGHVTPGMALVYAASQMAGGLLGYNVLLSLTPPEFSSSQSSSFCCTVPHASLTEVQAVAVEFLATSVLILVVCSCVDPRNADKLDSAPLKFGVTLMAICVGAGPYTGASFNPARSFAPALRTGTWTSHWVYWLGPLLSGFATALFYKAIFLPRSQQAEEEPGVSAEAEPLNQVKVGAAGAASKQASFW